MGGLPEIVDPKKSELVGMPRIKTERPSRGGARRTYSSKELDYCMKRALEDKLRLNGSEGHNLRVAIVVKAQSIGMTEEETAQLFRHQNDYDHDITSGKVVEIRGYDYQLWSCEALRDKCGKMITNYCRTCPMNHF